MLAADQKYYHEMTQAKSRIAKAEEEKEQMANEKKQAKSASKHWEEHSRELAKKGFKVRRASHGRRGDPEV